MAYSFVALRCAVLKWHKEIVALRRESQRGGAQRHDVVRGEAVRSAVG